MKQTFISPMMRSRKGNAFNIMKTGALALGIAFIVASVVALVLGEIDGQVTGTAQDVTGNATEGILNLTSFGGIFGTILAVVILLALVAMIKFKNR